MKLPDKSIATRIALLLGLFCLVLCAFLFSLLQLLKTLSAEADDTVNVTLPNMATASYITKESEWVKGILHDGLLCTDRLVHLGVMQEIKARRFPENVLQSLDTLAVDEGLKEKIRNNIKELDGILLTANRAVARRIDNLRDTARIVQRIRKLNEDLPRVERELVASGMAPADPAFADWRNTCSTCSPPCSCCPCTTTAPIPAAQERNPIRAQTDDRDLRGRNVPFRRPAELSHAITAMALSENGLLALYEEYTALESGLDTLKITHQYTSNSLIRSSNAISRQAWKGYRPRRPSTTGTRSSWPR